MASALPDKRAPTPQELFERLSHLASEMTETCSRVEDSLSDAKAEKVDPLSSVQDLDRMTQNLSEMSKLLARISLAESMIPASDLLEAIDQISLPSLKSFISDGTEQTERGEVDLF